MSSTSTERRVALVTGAAQGIGRAIALRLAEDPSGIDVAVLDIKGKEEQLAEVVEEIQKKGAKGLWITSDVTSEEQVKSAVEKTVQELGGLDIMVANAGVVIIKRLIEMTVEEWSKVQSTNALGTMLCYKHAAIQMIKQGRGGRIIGACSVAGKNGREVLSAYSASKFAVRGLTQSAALELRPHKITVNCYAPGAIDTPMGANAAKVFELIAANVPAAPPRNAVAVQVANPEVIAELVAYLIKPLAYFMTGQTIIIDGGYEFD